MDAHAMLVGPGGGNRMAVGTQYDSYVQRDRWNITWHGASTADMFFFRIRDFEGGALQPLHMSIGAYSQPSPYEIDYQAPWFLTECNCTEQLTFASKKDAVLLFSVSADGADEVFVSYDVPPGRESNSESSVFSLSLTGATSSVPDSFDAVFCASFD